SSVNRSIEMYRGLSRSSPKIILKCDGKPRPTPADSASERLFPSLCSMVSYRSRTCLVTCCRDSCGCVLELPADHWSPHRASLPGLDSPYAVSRTIRIRSAEPDLARFPACCHCRGRRALLPTSWIRLERDPNCC